MTGLQDNHSIAGPSGPICQCRCDELLIDVEGVKLDQVINEVANYYQQ